MTKFNGGDRVRYNNEVIKQNPLLRDSVGDVMGTEMGGKRVLILWEGGDQWYEPAHRLEKEWDV